MGRKIQMYLADFSFHSLTRHNLLDVEVGCYTFLFAWYHKTYRISVQFNEFKRNGSRNIAYLNRSVQSANYVFHGLVEVRHSSKLLNS